MFGHGFNTGLSLPNTLSNVNASLYFSNFKSDFDTTTFIWKGKTSIGTSGNNKNTVFNSLPPTGINFNSHTSIAFDGVTDYQNLTAESIYFFLTVSAYSTNSIVQFNSLAADAGGITTNPGIMLDSGGVFGVEVSSAGVQSWHYTGVSFIGTPAISLPLNTKLNVQSVYDGTNIKCRVNGGAWSSVAAANLSGSFSTGRLRIGTYRIPTTSKINGDVANVMTFQRALTQSEFDMLYQDAKISYGV